MPNYCDNRLEISGSEAEIGRFLTPLKPKEFDDRTTRLTHSFLETYLPEPKEWEAEIPALIEYARGNDPLTTEADIRENPWYYWRLKNWSSKWSDWDGDRRALLHRDEHGVVLVFETAWVPPVEGILGISQLFPSLTFLDRFRIEMNWVGQYTIKAGEVLQEEWQQMDWESPLQKTDTTAEAPVVEASLNSLLN